MLFHAIMSIPEREKQLEGNNAYVLQNRLSERQKQVNGNRTKPVLVKHIENRYNKGTANERSFRK